MPGLRVPNGVRQQDALGISMEMGYAWMGILKEGHEARVTFKLWDPFSYMKGEAGQPLRALEKTGTATRLELYCLHHLEKVFGLDPQRTWVEHASMGTRRLEQVYGRLEGELSHVEKMAYQKLASRNAPHIITFRTPLDREKKAIGQRIGEWHQKHGRPR